MHPSMYSAGELTNDEVEAIVAVMKNPLNHKIPKWFLNRQKDVKTGKYEQIISNGMQGKLREDLERLKKMRYASSPPCQCNRWPHSGWRQSNKHTADTDHPSCLTSGLTVVCATTGACACVASTPRPLDAAATLSALTARSKCLNHGCLLQAAKSQCTRWWLLLLRLSEQWGALLSH